VASLGDGSGHLGSGAGGMGQRGSDLGHEERMRRVLVHASGFRQSPYADIKPQGVDAADTRAQAGAERAKAREKELVAADDTTPPEDPPPQKTGTPPPGKLWHSSPGSSGW
jgi:error-prone DNA polymerase